LATLGLKLAQIFNVYGAYTPSKVSLYFKTFNCQSEIDYFNVSYFNADVPLWGAVIDSLNFISLTQAEQQLMAFDDVADYTGEGFLTVVSIGSSSTDPTVYYPIKVDDGHTGNYTIYVRARTVSGRIRMGIYIDGVHTTDIVDAAVPDTNWRWYSTTFDITDTDVKNLGIRMLTTNSSIDQIYIAPTASVTVPAGTGHDFTTSPYITVHGEVYTVGSDGRPVSPLYIYDYKTSAGELRFDGWYNFDLSFLDSRWAITFSDRYAIVIFSSGSDSDKYILWEFGDVDPYVCGPSAIKTSDVGTQSISVSPISNYGYYYIRYGLADITTDQWYIREDRGYYLNIYEYFDSLDEYGEFISILPAEERYVNVNSFSSDLSNTVNIEAISDAVGGEDLRLELDNKVASIIIDNSGSMGWNDPDARRFDTAERIVRKIDNVYPGNVQYTLFRFGGKPFTIVVAAGSEEDLISPDVAFSADAYGDSQSHFYGIRIVRNTIGYPTTPIDGEIVFDGIADSFIDSGLTAGQTYYYSLFTFDNSGNFSDGVNLQVTPNGTTVPNGISLCNSETLIGSGVSVDSDIESIWHFNEGSGRRVYDFNENVDLNITDEIPLWLNQSDVPSGISGLRFNGSSTAVSSRDNTNTNLYHRGFTIMAWVKPFSISGNRPIIAKQDAATSGWMLYIENATGRLIFTVGGVILGTSTIGLSLYEWNHVAITVSDNGTGRFYVNGILADTFSAPQSAVVTSKYLDIGYDRIGATYFFGELEEISVHNTERSQAYIQNYCYQSTAIDRDNGDRLVVINGFVPPSANYTNIHIVTRAFDAPANELDGEEIYSASAHAGSFYVTHRDDFIAGATYNFRIFTENVLGNFSNVYDSQNISLVIPQLSSETRQALPDNSDSLPSPTNVEILEGINHIYIQWNNVDTDLYENALGVRIYSSNTDFPVIEDVRYTGELVGEVDISQNYFTHRNLIPNTDYYYTIVIVDRYGRFSTAYNIKGSTNGGDNVLLFPLLDVESISYTITDDDAIKIFWDSILPYRMVQAYFDEKIAIYAKVIDEYGDVIEVNKEDMGVEISVDISYNYVDDYAADIFSDQSNMPVINNNDLYDCAIQPLEDGYVRGFIQLNRLNSNILFDIDSVNAVVKLKVKVPDPSDDSKNLFEYISYPLYIRFINPLELQIINRDNKAVSKRCPHGISALDYQPVHEIIKYDGAYLGASEQYVSRIKITYKNNPIDVSYPIEAEIHEVSKDLCDEDSNITDNGVSSIITAGTGTFYTVYNTEDVLDSSNNPTGAKRFVSYADISIPIPYSKLTTLIYVKYSYNNFSIVKRSLIVFDSPLQLEVSPRTPMANGVDAAEQFAISYLLDPDYPEDVTKRTYIESGNVKWQLTPTQSNTTYKSIYYSGDVVVDQPSSDNSVYSELGTGGVTRNVYIGPVSDISIISHDSNNQPVFEKHTLQVSCNYSGYVELVSYEMEFLPFNYDRDASAGSYLLMEFNDYKETFWTDGRNYAKAIISHDPSTSTTKYSNSFRNCLNSNNKDLVVLSPGQSVFINTTDPNLQIIWGDVIEYVDPYTGEWLLDTTDADIGYGSAFIYLSDGNQTLIFFRKNSVTNNYATSFERPTDNLCEDYIGIVSSVLYYEQITVIASAVVLHEGDDGTSIISLAGGGSIQSGILPTVLVPQEPLRIHIMDRRAGGSSIGAFIVDGSTINQILLDVSFSGRTVPDGTVISATIVNNNENQITLVENTTTTLTYVEPDFDPSARSYVTISLRPIMTGKTFDAKLYLSATYDILGSVSRTITICMDISSDAEDSISDTTVGTIRSIFSDAFEYRDISGGVPANWTSLAHLNHPRGHMCVEGVGATVYAIGGIDSSEVSSIVERYGFGAGTWSSRTSMPTSRMMAMSVHDGSNYIYVFGGITYDRSSGGRLYVSKALERYDYVADTWETLSDMPDVDLGGPDDVEYGVACGTAQYIDGKIYVFSGIREITDDGIAVDYNDRILSYDVATDTWSYSDPITTSELDNYERGFPVSFVEGTDIFVLSGSYRDLDSYEFITDAYSYNIVTEILDQAENKFDSMPELREKAAMVSSGNVHYIVGGVNDTSNNLKRGESFTRVGAPDPEYQRATLTNMIMGRNGIGLAVVNHAGNTYLCNVGGLESGKGNRFLNIATNIYENSMLLSRNQGIDIRITAKDHNDEYPNNDINAGIMGYLQFSTAQSGLEHLIPDSLLKHRVVIAPVSVVLDDGIGFARLYPRYDDYISELLDSVLIQQGSSALRYKIILQVIINDENFYGQTFVHTVDSIIDFEPLIDIECVSCSSNLEIDSLQYNNTIGFDLLTDKMSQGNVAIVNCYNDYPWIPYVENLTPSGFVSASSVLDTIDGIDGDTPIGGSPFYDCLVENANFLREESPSGTNFALYKIIYAFVDNEPNCSISSLDNAIMEVNGIKEYQQVPVMIANFSLDDHPDEESLYRRTDFSDYNILSSMTEGQAITIASTDVIMI